MLIFFTKPKPKLELTVKKLLKKTGRLRHKMSLLNDASNDILYFFKLDRDLA